MGIPDHLTCLLRNLYAGQEATVRTGHGTTDWFQIGKGVRQGCILSPCLFNLYTEYIMRNAGLEETQAGIKSFLLFKGQSWPLSLQYFFSSVLSFFFWYPNHTYIRDVILSHSLWMLLFYFFILLYLCFSVCVISIALSSCSLILSIICVKSADEASEGLLHLCYWH